MKKKIKTNPEAKITHFVAPPNASLRYTVPQPERTAINNMVHKHGGKLHVKNSISSSNKLRLDYIKCMYIYILR